MRLSGYSEGTTRMISMLVEIKFQSVSFPPFFSSQWWWDLGGQIQIGMVGICNFFWCETDVANNTFSKHHFPIAQQIYANYNRLSVCLKNLSSNMGPVIWIVWPMTSSAIFSGKIPSLGGTNLPESFCKSVYLFISPTNGFKQNTFPPLGFRRKWAEIWFRCASVWVLGRLERGSGEYLRDQRMGNHLISTNTTSHFFISQK